MTLISKTVYIDKSDGIVNKYNNTYHSAIRMKLEWFKIKHIHWL